MGGGGDLGLRTGERTSSTGASILLGVAGDGFLKGGEVGVSVLGGMFSFRGAGLGATLGLDCFPAG